MNVLRLGLLFAIVASLRYLAARFNLACTRLSFCLVVMDSLLKNVGLYQNNFHGNTPHRTAADRARGIVGRAVGSERLFDTKYVCKPGLYANYVR